MRTRSSTAKRLLKLITGISLMTLCAAPSVFALPPNTAILPTFEKEILTPLSQANFAWQNVAPNALASYYTYQPLLNADAVAAGFPAGCGDKRTGTLAADTGSTLDCYIISARELKQPMSLNFLNLPGVSGVSGLNAFPGPGLIRGDGFTPFENSATVTLLLANAAAGNLTRAYGYGSGGANWRPYYFGPAAGAAGTGPTLSRGNAPAAFATTPISAFTTNTDGPVAAPVILGDPAATGVWHFPAPTIKGTGGLPAAQRPVLVLWLNELPNVKPVGHDPSVDCGDKATFCYPYNRIVTHVHGAHVGPESDGLAVSWYTPDFSYQGEGAFLPTATAYFYKVTQPTGGTIPAQYVGAPIYLYPMTQEAGTIWYHDHAVGTTHNNTDMGMAGFFPITDAVEKNLQTAVAPALPVLPSGDTFELGFALQDRHFDITGQMIMPGVAVYDKKDPNCVFDINNNALPGTCARTNWMKTIAVTNVLDPNRVPVVHLIPYNAATLAAWKIGTVAQQADYALNFPAGPIVPPATAGAPCQANQTNTFENVAGVDPTTGVRVPFLQCAPFPATSATLEYFGNMPVVNGVTYAVYNVQPTVYRMRFIGGTDSRTFIAQLVKQNGIAPGPFTNAVPSMLNCGGGAAPAGCAVYDPASIVPFFQVGSEQGLLNSMVSRNELDIMGGERVDVLVDFTAYAGQTITMKNLGDDAPYSGRFDFDSVTNRMPTSLDIPEIMKFRVAATPVVTASAQTPVAGKALKTASVVGLPAKTRTIALIEITDEYGRTMPTIDARGYIPPGIRTTEIVGLNTIEQWDIVNTTVDAHPMHLHQVAFQAIDRQAIALIPGAVGGNTAAPSGFMAGYNNVFTAQTPPVNSSTAARQASIFTPSQYVPIGVATAVAAYDAGPKDTIQCPPGYVTRVKALFDLVGDYVWHCHILSHEEHDMMRPFRVTSTAALAAPTTVTVGAVVNGVVTVTVLPAPAATIQAVVQYRIVGTPFWSTNNQITSVQTVNLVLAGVGTYEFRAQFMEPAIQNVHANTAPDSLFTAGNTVNYAIVAPVAPTLVGPTGTVSSATPTYTWNVVPNATTYAFYNNFQNITTTYAASAICSGVTNLCSVTPAVVLPDATNVAWMVYAINTAGSSAWSAINSFKFTPPIPVAPILVSPSGTALTASPTYIWNVAPNATTYGFYNNFTKTITTYAASAICSGVTNLCSVTPAVVLPPATNVAWIVYATNSAGSSAWSATKTFVSP